MNQNDNDNDNDLLKPPEDEINKLKDTKEESIKREAHKRGFLGLLMKTLPISTGLGFKVAHYLISETTKEAKNLRANISNAFSYLHESTYEERISLLRDEIGLPEKAIGYYQWWINNLPQVEPMIFFMFLGIGYSFNLIGEFTVWRAKLLQTLNREIPTQIASPEAIITAYIKEGGHIAKYSDMLDRLGVENSSQQVYLDAIKQIPDVSVLFQNLWREKITTKQFNQYLAKLGFDKEEQPFITNLTDRIPPIQDIIRFAVREAFSDELSAKFQHDAEFPEDFAKWSKQQGFPEHWSKKYWRAHWVLPPITAAFEMLHRKVKKADGKIFNETDISDLLKMQDYSVAWRDLLTQISYKVITRVDARRLYDLGVWDNLTDKTAEEKVQDVYESQGYSPENAEYMKDFTVLYTWEKRRAFTTAGLKKLRKYGIITEEKLRDNLEKLRVRSDEIDYTIDEINYELEDNKFDSFMKYAKQMYLNDRWNKSQLQLEFAKVGLHISTPDNLFEAWDYDKKAKRRIASKSDILNWLKKGIIGNYKEALQMLKDLGYDDKTADYYIQDVIFDLSTDIKTLIKIKYITNFDGAMRHLMDIGFTQSAAENELEGVF